jgi:hypothetical protein
MGQLHSKQQQLASSVASSTAASASKPWGMRGGTAGAAAEAAAAATAPAQERDDLLHLLDEHMARWWVVYNTHEIVMLLFARFCWHDAFNPRVC